MNKDREVFHLEHFKDTYRLFPAGVIEQQKGPTFLLTPSPIFSASNTLRYFNRANLMEHHFKHRTILLGQVVSKASEIFSRDHVQSLYVQVLFHLPRAIIKQEVTRLAKAIVDAIEQTPYNPGVVVTINHTAGARRTLAKGSRDDPSLCSSKRQREFCGTLVGVAHP